MDASKLSRARALAPQALLGMSWLLCLSGCVSTSLVDRWKDASFSGPPLHKVLVVGVQRDDGARRVWEDGMVAALARQGTDSSASYRLFPSKAPTAEELGSTASREGFDGVLATHFVGASRRNYWVPGDVGFGVGWRWRYYGYWGAAYGPGYVETEHRSDYQTDVFTIDAAGGKLIWTGITRSIDVRSTSHTTDEIGHVLVPALIQQGILAGKHA